MTGVFVLTDVNGILSNTGGTKNATMRTDLSLYGCRKMWNK